MRSSWGLFQAFKNPELGGGWSTLLRQVFFSVFWHSSAIIKIQATWQVWGSVIDQINWQVKSMCNAKSCSGYGELSYQSLSCSDVTWGRDCLRICLVVRAWCMAGLSEATLMVSGDWVRTSQNPSSAPHVSVSRWGRCVIHGVGGGRESSVDHFCEATVIANQLLVASLVVPVTLNPHERCLRMHLEPRLHYDKSFLVSLSNFLCYCFDILVISPYIMVLTWTMKPVLKFLSFQIWQIPT